MNRAVRIGNISGFLGDRMSAARELLDAGDVDVLTGDWLAELTMLILAKQRMKHGAGSGWARPFLTQLETVLADVSARKIKVVTNAGGLDPEGAAVAVQARVAELGFGHLKIAYVTGDDLMPRIEELRATGLANLDTGEAFDESDGPLLTANAYLGGRGVTAALNAGADIVITGRTTDAAIVIGSAAWWHGWDYDNPEHLDALAGGLTAGHVIECGAQATGGNYAFFQDVPGLEHPGFPIAEIDADGSTVITKQPGTGGMVTPGTVTAQLLYEITGHHYANPDVTARFDTVQLASVGTDRVAITGVRGEPAPTTLKVAATRLGGFRNSMTLVMTGLDPDIKADLVLRTITGLGLGDLVGTAKELAARSTLDVAELSATYLQARVTQDPALPYEAQAELRITVKSPDPAKVAKPFTQRVIETTLSTYPGMFPTAPPEAGSAFGFYWPTAVDAETVQQTVYLLDGETAVSIGEFRSGGPVAGQHEYLAAHPIEPPALMRGFTYGDVERVAIGSVFGARSGDKGGAGNVGVWAPAPDESIAVAASRGEAPTDGVPDPALADARYFWLQNYIWPQWIHDLLPETAPLRIDVYRFPNLRAVNVVIHGLLGRGVADSTRVDPQAKGLGEHLRARYVNLPTSLRPGVRS
jgi:hypothetical protein